MTRADGGETARSDRGSPGRQIQAFQLFFAGATLYAALAVPLWVLQYVGSAAPWPERAASWHGHEMVFGYALAVVAGYLITRGSLVTVLGTLCTWLAARVVVMGPPLPALVEAGVALAFPAVLFALAGLPFLRAAKSWRNAVFGLLLAGFLGAEALYQLGTLDLLQAGQERGTILALDLVVLLLFTMGGRVIAAATSGAIRRTGAHLKGAAQHRLERAGVAVLGAMSLLDALLWAAPVAAILDLAAALVVLLRLLRWRAGRVVDVPEVSTLHLGYAWLAVGLLLKAAAQGLGVMNLSESMHGLMVGGLGTLSLVMMARVALQRLRRPIEFPPPVLAAVGLVSTAAVVRSLAILPELRLAMVEAAAIAWTAAFFVFALFLGRLFLTGRETR
ncbi:MAG: NnrS family protein [Gammaproteobacteria bacterium]|nr:NnrS family protein [Gammaproteobacteria bacterium]